MKTATYEVPTITIDMNEAAVLHAIAKGWFLEHKSEMNNEQIENWNQLLAKVNTEITC